MSAKRPVVRGDGKRYGSVEEAAADVVGDQTNICRACRQTHRTAYGWEWRYADEDAERADGGWRMKEMLVAIDPIGEGMFRYIHRKEVVRCRDCLSYTDSICGQWERKVPLDGYCHLGLRRDA